MDIDKVFNAGGVYIPNPNYSKSTKNNQPKYILAADLESGITGSGLLSNQQYDIFAEDEFAIRDAKTANKYLDYGILPTKYNKDTIDKQLYEAQGTGERYWNALKQTVVSEIVLGTIKSIPDLYDIVSGNAFRSDGDYTNPVSKYFAELQEKYEANNPIYQDPDKPDIFHGSAGTSGWWASNIPSIASTLTLLIPGAGAAKGLGLISKGLRFSKFAKFGRKALLTKNRLEKLKAGEKLGKFDDFALWANRKSTVTAANRMMENGVTALTMRTLENYQEAGQVYNDMYQEGFAALNNMSVEEYQDFLDKHSDEFKDKDINIYNRNEVAKAIAKNAADKTFIIDYSNLLFDVIQVNALRNPLKISKNMRTTAAVNKANREAALATGKTAEEAAKLQANKKFVQKAKDWLSDHKGAATIWSAESTEGIEEAVNFIAQQEGMNYGRVMIDPENNPETAFSDRFVSYLQSPGLYESAFWGVLGGVVFQGAGSKVRQVYHGIEGNIREKLDRNEKTQEKTNTNWKEKFETSENKRRVGEINGRLQAYETLQSRLKEIDDKDNPTNPFIRDNNDPNKHAAIISEQERQLARKQAINSYVDRIAMDAADAGNYDTLLAYIRDENVQNALKQIGLIDDSSQSVESIVERMNQTVERYENNMIMLDSIMEAFEDVPFEYLQIIARDNTFAELSVAEFDDKIRNYQVSAENNKKRFGANLSESIDYASAVKLVTAARRLSELRAAKRELLSDTENAKSLDSQNRLSEINNEINQINDYIQSDEFTNTDKPSSFRTKLARVLWANGISLQGVITNDGKFTTSKTDEYLDFETALASRNLKAINDLLNTNFEATDEDIISVFGENDSSDFGQYEVMAKEINEAFDIEKGIAKNASLLHDDYSMISALELYKLKEASKIANTTDTISTKVNSIHNYMNEARKKAIKEAQDILFEIGAKYKYSDVLDYIYENNDNGTIEEADKKRIDAAVEVLNLTADSNRQLAINLRETLAFASVAQEIQSQANSKNQNQNSSTSDTEMNNSPSQAPTQQNEASEQPQQATTQQPTPSPTAQPTPINPAQNTNPAPTNNDKTVATITSNIDGGLNVNTSVENSDAEFELTDIPNGDIQTSPIEGKELSETTKANTDLFEGYDKLLDDVTIKDDVEITYPVLAKDANENYYVKQKGQIKYNISSTGEGVRTNPVESATTTVSPTENTTTEETTSGKTTITPPVRTPEEKQAPTKNVVEVNDDSSIIFDADQRAERLFSINGEFTELIRNRNTDTPVEEAIEQAKQSILDKYKTDKDFEHIKKSIEKQVNFVIARFTRKGLIQKAADVALLSSSVTEKLGRLNFTEAYKKAASDMIEAYCKELGIRQVNGKYYINLEDVLRSVNERFQDKSVAELIYGTLNAYLKLNEAKDKFVVKDNSDSEQFLTNVKKSTKERIKEKIGNDHRVSIDRLFENPSPSFLKTFDSIEKGDKLEIEFINGEVSLLKNGVKIGTLPSPMIDSKTGNFYKYNLGWKTDVNKVGGVIVSNLRSIFENLLYEENEISKTIADAIIELNYGKPTTNRRNELINLVYDKLVNDLKLIEQGYISNSANKNDVVSYVEKLWKYFDTQGETPELRKGLISLSLDNWFEKMYDSYSSIDGMTKSLNEDPNSVSVEVTKITSGEIILNVPAGVENKGNNYDKFTYSNEAVANIDDVEFGIVDPRDKSTIITTTGQTVFYNGVDGTGKPMLVVHNKNGFVHNISGTSVLFSDKNVKGDARQIIDAVRTELNNLIESYIDKGDFNSLMNFIHSLASNEGNSALLTKIYFNKPRIRTQAFKFGVINGMEISVYNNGNKNFGFRYGNEREYKAENNNRSLNNEEDKKVFRELMNKILDEAAFNINVDYVKSANTKFGLNGFCVIDSQGKFNIYIPNSADPSKAFNKTYNSYKEAVLKGNQIKLNTHTENGNNFRRKGTNQAANQILEVSITRTTTSPVKESTVSQSAIEQSSPINNIEEVLTNSNITNKADALLDGLVTEEQLKQLNKLHLLPENIIFDENLNEKDENDNWQGDNAMARLSTGETFVGRKFIDMYNEEGEFANVIPGSARRQAIRKLIHEQLHHRINKLGRKKTLDAIEDIYNEFVKSIENASEENKEIARKYLFEKDADGNTYPRNTRLEEFLVESLTSEELVNYLNSVDATFDKGKVKKTLWRKIIELLNDIFGWNVREGSLREKELFALQDALKVVKKAINEIPAPKPKAKKVQVDNELQGTLNFDENINEEKSNEEINIDDLNLNDLDFLSNDTRHSSVTESLAQPSIPEFTNNLSLNVQAEFIASVATGDISTSCR